MNIALEVIFLEYSKEFFGLFLNLALDNWKCSVSMIILLLK